jgi:hypothetical protein
MMEMLSMQKSMMHQLMQKAITKEPELPGFTLNRLPERKKSRAEEMLLADEAPTDKPLKGGSLAILDVPAPQTPKTAATPAMTDGAGASAVAKEVTTAIHKRSVADASAVILKAMQTKKQKNDDQQNAEKLKRLPLRKLRKRRQTPQRIRPNSRRREQWR